MALKQFTGRVIRSDGKAMLKTKGGIFMMFFRFIVIGFFSLTALSLVSFQSIEIFQAFMDSFFQSK